MKAITPNIRLHTCNQHHEIYLNTLILEHQGNNFHLHGGTRDTIHVFEQCICLYVLTINKSLGYVGLNTYMAPEPDPINSIFLHTEQQIIETLGNRWTQMTPSTMAARLIDYLI